MEIEETFMPSDAAAGNNDYNEQSPRDYESDNDRGGQRYRNRKRHNRGGYNQNNRFRRHPMTEGGVMLQVELDRDMLDDLKEICGDRSIFWGIREACHQFVRNEREAICNSGTF